MNKYILIKYFKQEASEAEIDEIIRWVDSSEKNKKYFARMKQLWDLSGQIPQECPVPVPENRRPAGRKKLYRLLYFSSAALIALLLALNLMRSGTKTGPVSVSVAGPAKMIAENEVTVYTTKGVKGCVVLPDSSVVWMNSDSKVVYPAVFGNKSRKVWMSGEIFFEVKKDPSRPMYVTTNKNLQVEVLGTSFLIKSYNNDAESKTTLFSGSIVLHYKDKGSSGEKSMKIGPRESVVCKDAERLPVMTRPENIRKEIAWKDGELLFENTPMREVIKMLERWYGAEFIIRNEAVYNYKLTSVFQSESLSQVVDLMKYCMPLHFEMDNNVVTIY